MSKPPREWWIVDGCAGARLFDNEREAITCAVWLLGREPTFIIHVTEYSAYGDIRSVLKHSLNLGYLGEGSTANWARDILKAHGLIDSGGQHE